MLLQKIKTLFKLPVKTPTALTFDGWRDWDSSTKKKYPIRFWMNRELPIILSRIWRKVWKDPIYWLRTHTINRYHIIDCRNKDHEYNWGWCDRDSLLLLASFKIFSDYVEKELKNDFVTEFSRYGEPDDGDEYSLCIHNQIAAHIEMRELYNWWKVDRKKEREFGEKLTSAAFGGDVWDFNFNNESEELKLSRNICHIYDEAMFEKDQRMLHRLIELRPHLWT